MVVENKKHICNSDGENSWKIAT